MKQLKPIVVFVLVLSIFSAVFCGYASALIINDGDFGYELNSSTHEATLVKYNGQSDTVQLPAYFRDYPVTVISRNAFSGNTNIREVVFSDTNNTVEEYAFMNCTSLETVYIPENVVSFGDRVFAKCTSLQTVTLLSDIVSMPKNMFSGCSSLKNLTINENIAEFSYGCFNGCSSLTNMDFVSNGALLQSYSFNGTGAESVVLSDSLLAIPNYAFTNCPNLRYLTIPESVVLIQPNAFDHSVTIRCYADSYAQVFAEANNIPYELIVSYETGDVNRDGVVNITDATEIQRYLAEIVTFDGDQIALADVDGDGDVSISDATALQFMLAS